jgi:CDP-paratose 2-epimerase
MPIHQRILITGGAGFVGSSVALALKTSYPQTQVTAFDNLHRRGSELNLSRLRNADVAFVHGDIRSLADLTGMPELPDLIVECSAEPSAQAGYGGSPEYLIDTNLIGCYHCLELARHARADFVFISTSRVYPYRRLNDLAYEEGPERFHLSAEQTVAGASGLGVNEDFPLDGPRSLYGMTKLAGELMVAEYADAYGIRYLIDRCGLLTGPWQMAKSDQGVIALWMADSMVAGGRCAITCTSTTSVSYCWSRSAISKAIRDVCSTWGGDCPSACRYRKPRVYAKKSQATAFRLRRWPKRVPPMCEYI